MRAREFLNELKLDIPNQMVTVQVPLSDIISGSNSEEPEKVVNPGKRTGSDGKFKWSPPLQQHLDATKDSVGPSTDDIVDVDADSTTDDELDTLKKNLASLFSKKPSMP